MLLPGRGILRSVHHSQVTFEAHHCLGACVKRPLRVGCSCDAYCSNCYVALQPCIMPQEYEYQPLMVARATFDPQESMQLHPKVMSPLEAGFTKLCALTSPLMLPSCEENSAILCRLCKGS